MLRTVKYLSLLVVQFIGALLGVGALFIAFYAVSTPLSEFESAGWRILGMAFACGMMFPFVLQASLIQSYMPLPLSMGVTRRGFFAGAQAAKVMLAGGIGVCLLLIQLAVKWMFGCCFSKRMRKLFRKNEKSVLRFCNKSSKTKRAFTKVLMPCKRPF